MAIRFASFEGKLEVESCRYDCVSDRSSSLRTLAYKQALADENGKLPSSRVFLGESCSYFFHQSQLSLIPVSHDCVRSAGLMAGATEAVLVVSPMEVIKIRLQAQHHSLADPTDIPKYR
jgi:hypothetical protein